MKICLLHGVETIFDRCVANFWTFRRIVKASSAVYIVADGLTQPLGPMEDPKSVPSLA
jgi:hypothetical protein